MAIAQFDIVEYPGEHRFAPHRHEDAVIVLMLKGAVREEANRNDVNAGPLAVGLKPPEQQHSDHFGPGLTRALRVRLAPEEWDNTRRQVAGLDRTTWHFDAAVARPLLRLAESLRSGLPDETRVDALWDAIAGIACRAARAPIPDALYLVRAELHDRFREHSISSSRFAKQCGCHPAIFARDFRALTGRSLTSYVRLLRVRAAAKELCANRTSIADIAFRCGFYDQPHLTRAFTRELGITPARYRRLAG